MSNKPNTINLLAIGCSCVGKSSISDRFCKGIFSSNLMNTVGIDYRTRTIHLRTKKLKITIWDTAGQDHARVLPATTIRKAEGILFVFGVDDQKTVNKLKDHIEACKEIIPENSPVIIVGNKIDINNREVTEFEGKKFADKIEYEYFETSALSGVGVDIAFFYIIRKIMVKKGYELDEFDEYVRKTLKEENDISRYNTLIEKMKKETVEKISNKEDSELNGITITKMDIRKKNSCSC